MYNRKMGFLGETVVQDQGLFSSIHDCSADMRKLDSPTHSALIQGKIFVTLHFNT